MADSAEQRKRVLDEIEQRKARIEQIKTTNDGMVEEAKILDAELDPIDAEINRLQKQLLELRRTQDVMRSESNKIRYKRNSIEHQVNEGKDAIEREKKEIAALNAELHRLEMTDREAELLSQRSEELDVLARQFAWHPDNDQIPESAFPHQIDGAKRMALLDKVAVGDEMGLGKSLQALMACDLAGAKRILIISKIDIIENFAKEVERFAPHRCAPHGIVFKLTGRTSSEKLFQMKHIIPNLPGDMPIVTLLNFEAYWNKPEVIMELINHQYDTVIFDEAHHMKELKRNTFRGFAKVIRAVNKCVFCGSRNVKSHDFNEFICQNCHMSMETDDARSIKRIYPMTGSPVLNRPDEFYPLLWAVDPDAFPTIEAFLYSYCIKRPVRNLNGNWTEKWDFASGGSERLLTKIGPRFLRRTKKDAGIILPPQTVTVHNVPFSEETHPKQFKAYHDLFDYFGMLFNEDGDGEVVAPNGSTLIGRLRQMTSYPAGIVIKNKLTGEIDFQCDVTESAKLDACFEDIVEKFEEKTRVIFFSRHVEVLKEMKRRLDAYRDSDMPIRSVIYYGGTSLDERKEIQQDFDIKTASETDYRWDVVLCQNETASQGLNLTAAKHMVIAERAWGPKLEEQMLARIDRIGQNVPTTANVFQLEDTIDINFEKMLFRKGGMVADFENNASVIQALINDLYNR